MPFGYLLAITLVAWCTFFAVAAPRGTPALAAMSFRFGLALNELPFLGLYWTLGATLLAAAQDDLSSAGGQVVLAVAAATTAGLVLSVRRSLRARPVLEAALGDGLGVDWRRDLGPDTAARLRRRPPLGRILFGPVLVRGGDVEHLPDIPYGDAGPRNLLDVYRRGDITEGAPVLVYFHGGGFRSGRKDREALPLLYRLAGQGWVCVSANYRLSPQARFPDPLVDAKKVIAWVREHGRTYGTDGSALFVAGSSAGGHMSCMAALTPNDPAYQPGFEQADTSVTAAISLYGYHGPVAADGRRPSSPADHLRPDAPPILLAHGDKDTLVPVEDTRTFARRLADASSGPVVHAELPGAQHSFDLFHSLRFEAVVDAVESFAAWVLATRNSPRTDARDL
ncbi:alpha/beta hydrolase [Streptomyces sp. NPDC006289]|uniref:alpha/beta hydrolase n=1 Tax=Streptomyces sp. NPDC006289 TaxID=3156744 RepID=UPI0033B30148